MLQNYRIKVQKSYRTNKNIGNWSDFCIINSIKLENQSQKGLKKLTELIGYSMTLIENSQKISGGVWCTEITGLPRVFLRRHSPYPDRGTKFVDVTELSDKGTKVLQN